VVDKFPLGALMNKALTVRGAQMRGQRYIPEILERMARDEIVTEHLVTHVLPLEEGQHGYDIFQGQGRWQRAAGVRAPRLNERRPSARFGDREDFVGATPIYFSRSRRMRAGCPIVVCGSEVDVLSKSRPIFAGDPTAARPRCGESTRPGPSPWSYR
jgi:hypothetical protein